MKTEQQKKNQRLIMLIFALAFTPFLMAWYLKENPELLTARTKNNGTLIIPLISTEVSEFSGFDQFTRDNIKELAGHWVLVNVIPESECTAVCLKSMHDTKQLLLMMGKDLVRIRRMALLLSPVESKVAQTWWPDDTRLLRVTANATVLQKIQASQKLTLSAGMILLMDPLGNLMMQYAPGVDPYKIRDDLKKLLAVSQIG